MMIPDSSRQRPYRQSTPELSAILPRSTNPRNADFALIQGIFLVITIAVLLANLLADFIYVFLDPRTRQEG